MDGTQPHTYICALSYRPCRGAVDARWACSSGSTAFLEAATFAWLKSVSRGWGELTRLRPRQGDTAPSRAAHTWGRETQSVGRIAMWHGMAGDGWEVKIS